MASRCNLSHANLIRILRTLSFGMMFEFACEDKQMWFHGCERAPRLDFTAALDLDLG